MDPLVVVGASLAGVRAAAAARRAGWDGDIVVVGDEPHMPYTRPPLSKELLTSPAQDVSHHLLPAAPEATWLLGRRATGLDRAARRLDLADGEQLPYDRLIIATGCRPRRWTGPGAELRGTARDSQRGGRDGAPRSADQARRWRSSAPGSSAARSHHRRMRSGSTSRCSTSSPRPCRPRAAARRALRRAPRSARRASCGSASGSPASTVRRAVRAVELADGSRHEADVVVIALGAVPCTRVARRQRPGARAGSPLRRDADRDGDPDVLAAGDVAAWPHPLAGGEPIRVEHWTNAAEQGAVCRAQRACRARRARAYASVPSFWSDQYDVKIQAVGLPHLAERPAHRRGIRRRLAAGRRRRARRRARRARSASTRPGGCRGYRSRSAPARRRRIRTSLRSPGAPARLCA